MVSNEESAPAASFPNSFDIPQFHIVGNNLKSSNINPYSLQLINETDDSSTEPSPSLNPNNQLIPIHYDTSFLDSLPPLEASNHHVPTVKDEYILGQPTSNQCYSEQMQLPQLGDEDDDNFEIDHFFRMKPKEMLPVQPDSTLVKIEGDHGESEMPIDLSSNKDADCQVSEANDIIQQAAIIEDDFFSHIRESMDVLYDKVLC